MSIKLNYRRVYYTPQEFAAAANISLATVYRYCDERRLLKVQPGGPHHWILIYALEVLIPPRHVHDKDRWRLAIVGRAQAKAAQRRSPRANLHKKAPANHKLAKSRRSK